MCGIWASIFAKLTPELIRKLSLYPKLSGRGPDGTYSQKVHLKTTGEEINLVFHHLALQGGTAYTHQPLMKDGVYLICNGHIYNHYELYTNSVLIENGLKPRETPSDCEILLSLYSLIANHFSMERMSQILRLLDGVFAGVLVDTLRNRVIIFRDEFGVRPVYISQNRMMGGWIVSSLKRGILGYTGKESESGNVVPVMPGSFLLIESGWETPREVFWKPPRDIFKSISSSSSSSSSISSNSGSLIRIQEALKKSIDERLKVKSAIGCLLSGGVMSTLICKSVVDWFLENRAGRGRSPKRIAKEVHTFTIGIGEDHPDIVYSRKVAEVLGTTHHELIMKPEDMRNERVRREVIDTMEIGEFDEMIQRKYLEQGIPMWLLGRFMKKVSEELRERKKGTIKKLLIGEGMDLIEHPERIQKAFENEYLVFDRCLSSWGFDVEFPWLDLDVYRVILHEIKNNKHHIPEIFERMLQREMIFPEDIRNRKYIPMEKVMYVDAM
jgi:asparagine synthase (glutamine-hydrolysing)